MMKSQDLEMVIKVKAHCDVTLFKNILMFTGKNTPKKSTKMFLVVQSEWYDLLRYKEVSEHP